MSDLISKLGRPVLLLLFALAFFLGAYFFYHPGRYDPPTTIAISIEGIAPPPSLLRTLTELPLIQMGNLLVDGMHGNNFTKEELSVLLSRVADRGFEVEVIGEPSRFGGFSTLREGARLSLLREKLRSADSLAVILPNAPYSREEANLVEQFVLRKGGKLLLIADPTRRNEINSLAERFGIAFQPDYLYNTVDYELNFQNIFIRHFDSDEITRELEQIALYTAGSIRSATPGLAFTDGNTRSSMFESVEPFYPLVKSGEGRVLALADLTFMIPPRNSILDNDRLVSNIADYLTSSQRKFDLADFPHFFREDVDILLGRSALFDVASNLKGMLSSFQIGSKIPGVEDITKDTVYIGLYEDSSDVAQYLELAGIGLDGTLRTPFTPDIVREDTAIILLHAGLERHVLVILGDSESALREAVAFLGSGEFRDGLIGDTVGVYRTQ